MEAGGAAVTGDDGFVDPRWSYPEYPPDATVELRIHGVGGEAPSGMTRDPQPRPVGGDERVGFWRARNPTVGPGHVREVVSWGGATSGDRRSAFWVLLLPFALFNAAGRMVPAGASAAGMRWHQRLCRWLALCLTLSFVLLTGALLQDLLVVQCAALVDCVEAPLTGRWLLAPLRGLRHDVGALMAAMGLVPAVVVLLLRVAGRRQLGRPATASTVDVAAQRLDEPAFWQNLWPAWRLRSLHINAGYAVAALHLAAGHRAVGADGGAWWLVVAAAVTALVVTVVVTGMARVAAPCHDRALARGVLLPRFLALPALGLLVGAGLARVAGPDAGWLQFAVAVAAAAMLVHAVRTVRGHVAGDASAPSGSSRDLTLLGGTVLAGLLPPVADVLAPPVVAAQDLVVTSDLPLVRTLTIGLPGHVWNMVWALVAVQTVLLVALACVEVAGHRRRATARARVRGPLTATTVPFGLGATLVALVSLFLVTAVAGGLHAFALDWLGSRAGGLGGKAWPKVVETVVDARDDVRLVLPWWYATTAQTVVVFAVAVGSAAAVVYQRIHGGLRPRAVKRRGDVPVPTSGAFVGTAPPVRDALLTRGLAPVELVGDDPRWKDLSGLAERMASAWTHGALVRAAGGLLASAVAATTVVLALLLLVDRPWNGTDLPTWSVTLPLVLLALLPVAVVALMRNARGDRGLRRQVGTIWDTLTFWPRVTHPFAPPCYGESLVPAVAERVSCLGDRRVVLAGHSQGSVVALASSLLVPPGRVTLVTYGSPLATLYEGFFPTVFGGEGGAIDLGTRRHTWWNVFALTEPFAAPLWTSPTGPWTPDDLRAGWPLHLALPRLDRLDASAGGGRGLDVTITDPDRAVSPTGEVDGRVLGHSSYHRSRELDLFLSWLAQ